MSRRNWQWTDDPAVLRSRVARLTSKLDEAEQKVRSLQALSDALATERTNAINTALQLEELADQLRTIASNM